MTNKKEFDGAYNGLSRLFLVFNIDFDDFFKGFKEYHVRATYKSSGTIARTALRVGLDRRIVSAIISGHEQYRRTSSLLIIVNEVEKLARLGDMTVNKKGKYSLQSIIKKVANGATTLNSVVDELCALGCIEDLGIAVRFLTNLEHNQKYKEKTLQKFSHYLDMYVDDLIKNFVTIHPLLPGGQD